MDNSHAADRVRPILAAMERSIDIARQRRLQARTEAARPIEPPITGQTIPGAPASVTPDQPPRLKARPKRDPRFGNYETPDYRNKAS